MASYANENASCGPHFDHYDVFLVQVRGNKRWHLDDGGHKDADLSPSAEIRLLQNFNATQVLDQRPGDILYIPPGTGHWGVASDDSLTLSVGIRNPTLQEMISHLADRIGDELDTGQTLDDSLSAQGNGISVETTRAMSNKMAGALLNPSVLNQWFGAYMTELREPDLVTIPGQKMTDKHIADKLVSCRGIRCHLATRLAYQVSGGEVKLYVNGESYSLTTSILTWLTPLEADREVDSRILETTQENIHVLSSLINAGAVSFV
jgi:50S ribosomal protein L16 3-hydroxylase